MEGSFRCSPRKTPHGPATPARALCGRSWDRGGQSRAASRTHGASFLSSGRGCISLELDVPAGVGVKQGKEGRACPGAVLLVIPLGCERKQRLR